MSSSKDPESSPRAAQSVAACPVCASTVIEETPFRTDSEVICRCFQCLTVFRVKAFALAGNRRPYGIVH